jgi:hypothetical protein
VAQYLPGRSARAVAQSTRLSVPHHVLGDGRSGHLDAYLASSLQIRGAPQVKLAIDILRINARISRSKAGRPSRRREANTPFAERSLQNPNPMAQGQILNGQILLGLEERQSGSDETYEHGEHRSAA